MGDDGNVGVANDHVEPSDHGKDNKDSDEYMSVEATMKCSAEKPPNPGSDFRNKRKREDSESDQVPDSKHRETERRKSQRRSSFVRGRVSIQLPAKTRGERDFTQEIDPNLPSDERLARLYAAALEFSLDKICQENEELDGMQQFRIEGRENGYDVIEKLVAAGAFKEATTLQKGLLNPENIVIEEGIAALESYRNKLQKECDDWDRILQERSRLSEEAARKSTDAEGKVLSDPPTTLSAEQKALLESAPSYNMITDLLKKVNEEVHLFAIELEKKSELMSSCRKFAADFVSTQAKIIGDMTTDKNVKLKTPRKLLAEFTRGKLEK